MLGNIGPLEIAIVVVIALLVFGPKRLPELGRSTGKGIREFKSAVSEFHEKEEPAELPAATEQVSEETKKTVSR